LGDKPQPAIVENWVAEWGSLKYRTTHGTFGSLKGDAPVAGIGVIASPLLSCEPLNNTFSTAQANHKKIFVSQRGECQFSQKAMVAQLAGADAILLFNTETDPDPVSLAGGVPFSIGGKSYTAADVTIPVHFITCADGKALLSAMGMRSQLRIALGMPGWEDVQHSIFGVDKSECEECINQNRVCDGASDCRNGADESNCVIEPWSV
jgi:hypothetical protein